MSNRKHIVRIFSTWNDEKEERWLERMAQSGWRLVGGPVVYCFEQGDPAPVRYRMDYRSQTKNLDEYLRLCADAGWEKVLDFCGSYYFRTANPNAPEIFTDHASRIAKYQRALTLTVILCVTTMAANFVSLPGFPGSERDPVETVFRWLVLALCVAWVYVIGRLVFHIWALKHSSPRYRNS